MSHLGDEVEELRTQINNVVDTLARKHHKERVKLLARHEGYLPYGVSAWAKHKTFDENYIFNQLILEEILFKDLYGSKTKLKKSFVEPNLHDEVISLEKKGLDVF